MFSLKRISLALVLLVAVTGLSLAQPPRQGGGGGMMMGAGRGVTGLLTSKTVQTDLKITEEQSEKLKAWGKEFAKTTTDTMTKAMEGIEKGDFKAMQERMPKVMAEISKTAYKQIGEVLKPEQVKRLKQVEVQVAGTRAFGMPEVKEGLKLTEEQEAKIKDANDVAAKDMRDLGEEYGLQRGFGRPMDPEKAKEFDKKRAVITKENMSKIKGALTEDQKKAWGEMVGADIDVNKIQTEMMAGMTGGFRPKKKDD
ncbi:MAG: hypothetical protein ACRC8S_19490 [Fimbriiglobus sp.]